MSDFYDFLFCSNLLDKIYNSHENHISKNLLSKNWRICIFHEKSLTLEQNLEQKELIQAKNTY